MSADKRCGSCRYWAKQPRPQNPQTGAIDLAVPAVGQCRGAPPQMVLIPTPAGANMNITYPSLPAEFPACRLHAERVPLGMANGVAEELKSGS